MLFTVYPVAEPVEATDTVTVRFDKLSDRNG